MGLIMGLEIPSESHLGRARVSGSASLTSDREAPLAEMTGARQRRRTWRGYRCFRKATVPFSVFIRDEFFWLIVYDSVF